MGQTEVLRLFIEERKKGGGWLTVREVKELLGNTSQTCNRSVIRLYVYGFLEIRSRDLKSREFCIKEAYLDA